MTAPARRIPSLTTRQMTLLGLLADGLNSAQIERRLDLSGPAVRMARARLRSVMGAMSDAQVVHRAHELGLLRAARPALRPPTAVHQAVVVAPVARGVSALTPKPGATADDARLIAARLEASFRGGAR